MKSERIYSVNLDTVGFVISAVCALHCAALPFLLTLLPLIGLSFFTHPLFEAMIIIIGLVIGFISMIQGFIKHHRKLLPTILLSTGFLLIWLGHIEFSYLEQLLVPAGALTVAISHLLNARYIKTSSLKKVCDVRTDPTF